MNLKGKVAVITGGAQGLGKSMAIELAAAGADIAVFDMNEEAGQLLVAELRLLNVRAEFFMVDVTNETNVIAMFDLVVADMGAVDILVNNAGITKDAMLLKVDRETGKVVKTMALDAFQAVIDVNLTGSFLCGREAASRMVDAGNGGVIINIASICRTGNKGQTNYSASKAGTVAMMEAWTKELVRYGIRCNAIAPGYIGTDMVNAIRDDIKQVIINGIPQKRLGEPTEIAQTVRFICENDFVNGTVIEVNGGQRI